MTNPVAFRDRVGAMAPVAGRQPKKQRSLGHNRGGRLRWSCSWPVRRAVEHVLAARPRTSPLQRPMSI